MTTSTIDTELLPVADAVDDESDDNLIVDPSSEDSEYVFYAIKLSVSFAERIEKHLNRLKSISGSKFTKQKWFTDAIAEKLSKYAKGDWTIPVPRQSVVKIKSDLHQKLSVSLQQIEKLSGRRLSKKTWVVESLEEKLLKDEEEMTRNINFSGSK